jgi:hypothetical protein
MKHLWPVLILIGLLIGLGLYFSAHGTMPAVSNPPQVSTVSTSTVITDKESIVEEKKLKYEISIFKPIVSGHVNSASFNTMVDKLFSVVIDEFVTQSTSDYQDNKADIEKVEGPASNLELIGTAKVFDNRYVSLVVSKNYYVFHTAHPAHIVETFLYDLDQQKVLGINNIFSDTKKALVYISAKSKEQLINKLKEDNNQESLDDTGLEPVEANFNTYTIDNEGMRIMFGEYQVLPYVFGPQEATFTWEELRPLLTPEFKAFIK